MPGELAGAVDEGLSANYALLVRQRTVRVKLVARAVSSKV